MVRPMVLSHAATKVLGFVVSGSLRSIDNPIFIPVLGLKEFRNSFNGVAIHAFYPIGGVAHSNDSRGDISEV